MVNCDFVAVFGMISDASVLVTHTTLKSVVDRSLLLRVTRLPSC